MNRYEATKVILQTFITGWAASAFAAVPLLFENDVVDEPATYVRVRVLTGPSEQTVLGPPGNRKYGRTGTIRLDLKISTGSGTKQLDQMADAATTILEGVRMVVAGSEDLVTFAASELPGPVDDKFQILAVLVPFEYYQLR